MFILETNGDKARVDSIAGLREWLLGMSVDGQLKIKGLGHLLVLRNFPYAPETWLCSFVPDGPLGKWGGRETDLEEILAMATQMMAGLEEDTSSAEVELEVEDGSVEVWRVEISRGHQMWYRAFTMEEAGEMARRTFQAGPRPRHTGTRHERLRAGANTYRAKDYKPGTVITIKTVVEIKNP